MDDLTGLGKLADSKLLNQTYKDALSPAFQEGGKAFQDVIKTFRLFIAPLQLLAVAQDRLAAFCERVRAGVPEERHIEAAPSIAIPALLELRYMEDDNPITNLYINLLMRAIDRDRKEEAHPAFTKLISQLSPDEALILHHLASAEICTIEYRYDNPGFPLHSVVDSDYPVPNLAKTLRMSMYLEHLEFLNLVHYNVGGVDVDNTVYPGHKDVLAFKAVTKLTQFGRLFVTACEP